MKEDEFYRDTPGNYWDKMEYYRKNHEIEIDF